MINLCAQCVIKWSIAPNLVLLFVICDLLLGKFTYSAMAGQHDDFPKSYPSINKACLDTSNAFNFSSPMLNISAMYHITFDPSKLVTLVLYSYSKGILWKNDNKIRKLVLVKLS